jgi:hypothetical protein
MRASSSPRRDSASASTPLGPAPLRGFASAITERPVPDGEPRDRAALDRQPMPVPAPRDWGHGDWAPPPRPSGPGATHESGASPPIPRPAGPTPAGAQQARWTVEGARSRPEAICSIPDAAPTR